MDQFHIWQLVAKIDHEFLHTFFRVSCTWLALSDFPQILFPRRQGGSNKSLLIWRSCRMANTAHGGLLFALDHLSSEAFQEGRRCIQKLSSQELVDNMLWKCPFLHPFHIRYRKRHETFWIFFSLNVSHLLNVTKRVNFMSQKIFRNRQFHFTEYGAGIPIFVLQFS